MAQSNEQAGGKKVNSKGQSKCFHCDKDRHWIRECLELLNEQKKQLKDQAGDMLTQGDKGVLCRNYSYLDSCTTNNQIVNPSYLTGIKLCDKPLKPQTNIGTSISNRQGYLGSHKFGLTPTG